MTDTQLRKIYIMVCDGKGYEANDGQFKVWKQTLGWCEEVDLAQAVLWWMADNATFPMPAELKPLVERAKRARLAKASVKTGLVRFYCPDCGIYTCGFLAMDDNRQRICRGNARIEAKRVSLVDVCGGVMNIVHDDRLASA
jgi:hypothetical protein